MKKDVMISIVRIIIWLSLISYVSYLWYNHMDILPKEVWNNDIIVLSIVWVLWAIITLFWIIKPCLKKPRVTQVIVWLIVILFPTYAWIVDSYTAHIYLWDILRVLWVIITILWFTKMCIYNSCTKKAEQKKVEEMEIIEV